MSQIYLTVLDDYELENGIGKYYYEDTSAISPWDPGAHQNHNYTMPLADELIPETEGSIGFATISDDFKLGSGYLWHDLFGYFNQIEGNSHTRMSWRILDYQSGEISIGHKIMRSEAYRTKETVEKKYLTVGNGKEWPFKFKYRNVSW